MLGDDYLAAPVGWLFFFDLPRALIGFGTNVSNRADLSERAWEASWPDTGLGLSHGIGALWTESNLPPVLFNGASVNDGCRVNVSVLDVAGGSPDVPSCSGISPAETTTGVFGATHDVVDFLCPADDLALSTAAGMSARFPIISLAGRIAADPDRNCGQRAAGAVFVADGGYLEGSGAGSLLDSWTALSARVEQHNVSQSGTCVVPFMIHIDNGYESPIVTANDAVPREFLVPLLATLNSSSGITTARAEAALAFEHGFSIGGADTEVVELTKTGPRTIQSRYARLVTRAHPGVQAPLGWTLSQASINDLRDQLAIPGNVAALAEIRTWIDRDLACVSSPEA
jgi:hypothetical protein